MDLYQKAALAVESLEKEYPDAVCSLKYTDAFQLLIATRLAAQCTDLRVNMVTPALFEKYPDIPSMAAADVADVEDIIKSCGLYKTKARDIVSCAIMLRDEFDGKVPDEISQLIKLPGIGRKTANLVVGDIYGKSAVVVDTHCIRITRRLGFHNLKDPTRIEMLLREYLPPIKSNDFCHRLVLHGRAVCSARSPKCDKCCMNGFCSKLI
ncbi:MAG: endonuclease III [Clostridia bacterium]|nr:endonuclease III [Clostridia bacterium]